ncbi:hypothetical protein LR48_Vigan03g188000 [Vigna angularis]|uniref:Uncharacterized protein n=1 Tax=Phaseolus angularis TaxID=3914 RepID=A0A0L9U6S7_PHAAN|nr:hypothetical protein LR48_Vigan03g188000 [Vigna angularis]
MLATRLNDVRTLGLNRSTIRLIDVRQLGLDRSAFFIDVRPLAFGHARFQHSIVRPFGLTAVRQYSASSIQPASLITFVRSSSNRSVIHGLEQSSIRCSAVGLNDVRPLGLHPFASVVRRFTSQAFQHSFSRTLGLKRPTLSLPDVTVDGQPKTERSKGYTPSSSCSPKNTQNINRSTIHVHERSTGYTPSSCCSPKNTQNINRSTIHVHERSTGYTPSEHPEHQPLDNPCPRAFYGIHSLWKRKPSVLRDTLPLVVVRPRTPRTSTARQSMSTSVLRDTLPLVVVHPRTPRTSTARQSMSTSVLRDTLPLVVVRPRTPRTSTARQSMSTSVLRDTLPLVVVRPRTPRTSTARQSMYERSSSRPFGLKGVGPLVSTARPSMCTSVQAVGRSASKVFALWFQPLDHPCVRAFKQSVVRSQRCSPLVSTARQLMCTSVQAVGRSASLWFQPLDNSCVRAFKQLAVRHQRYSHFDLNRSAIHSHERSSIRSFDAINVVHSASMTFVRLASIIRSHMPLDLYRPWPQAFSSYDLRLYSLYRSAIPVLTFGLTHSRFFAVRLHIFSVLKTQPRGHPCFETFRPQRIQPPSNS